MVISASPGMLLTILILLIIGILIIVVWLVNYIAGPSTKKKSKKKQPNAQFSLEPSTEPSEPSPTVGDDEERRSLPMRVREIMRVLRDEDTGAIIIEIEGNRYRRLTEIQDGRIGNQVLEAIADLIKFTGGIIRGQWAAASVPILAPTEERPPESQVVRPASPSRAAEPSPSTRLRASGSDKKEAFLHRLREGDLQVGKPLPEEKRPSITGFIQRRKPQVAAEEAGTEGTFIDEIEDILQGIINTAPTPLDEEVHVGTGPKGGLQIQVGTRYFSSADEVPDPAIRSLIKAAVKEWERS